jgi:hypothetical protein
MGLKATLDTLDELDESLHEHYKLDEKSKKYVLDLEGFDGLPAVRALKDESAKHRIKAKEATDKLTTFAALGDLDTVRAQLDRIPELEAAAEGKLDENKINSLVEGRIKTKLAPLERERDQLKTQLTEKDEVIKTYSVAETRRKVTTAVGKAARELKVVDSAVEDIEIIAERVFEVTEDGSVVTRDNVGTTPGLSVKAWLEDMQAKRPHWWGPSAGGGANGNGKGGGLGGPNPWTHEGWSLTEQGALLKSDRAKAERLAKAAGTSIGGKRPPPKK